MTGRQSVPGLKGASRIGSFVGRLAWSLFLVLLSGFRGVRGAIGETCSSTPGWPLLPGLGARSGLRVHGLLPIQVLTRWGSQASRRLGYQPGQYRGARTQRSRGVVFYRGQGRRHGTSLGSSGQQDGRVGHQGQSQMVTHFLMCGQAAPRRRGEGLSRGTCRLSCLPQELDLFLKDVNGTIGPEQI